MMRELGKAGNSAARMHACMHACMIQSASTWTGCLQICRCNGLQPSSMNCGEILVRSGDYDRLYTYVWKVNS
jgi:hypothetical protein